MKRMKRTLPLILAALLALTAMPALANTSEASPKPDTSAAEPAAPGRLPVEFHIAFSGPEWEGYEFVAAAISPDSQYTSTKCGAVIMKKGDRNVFVGLSQHADGNFYIDATSAQILYPGDLLPGIDFDGDANILAIHYEETPDGAAETIYLNTPYTSDYNGVYNTWRLGAIQRDWEEDGFNEGFHIMFFVAYQFYSRTSDMPLSPREASTRYYVQAPRMLSNFDIRTVKDDPMVDPAPWMTPPAPLAEGEQRYPMPEGTKITLKKTGQSAQTWPGGPEQQAKIPDGADVSILYAEGPWAFLRWTADGNDTYGYVPESALDGGLPQGTPEAQFAYMPAKATRETAMLSNPVSTEAVPVKEGDRFFFLASCGDYAYVQAESESSARGFIAFSALEVGHSVESVEAHGPATSIMIETTDLIDDPFKIPGGEPTALRTVQEGTQVQYLDTMYEWDWVRVIEGNKVTEGFVPRETTVNMDNGKENMSNG